MRALPLLVLALLIGTGGQEPSPEPSPAPSPEPRGLAGRWAGSAKYQTDAGQLCRYEGVAEPPSLSLDLRQQGGRLELALAPPAGTPCPPFAIESPLSEVTLTESTASFRDAQGRQWNLALQAGVLRGLVSGSDGSGEFALQRRRGERRAAREPRAVPDAPATPGATQPAATEPAAADGTAGKPTGPGLKAGTLGILGANVLGLGALLAVNQAVQDDSAGTSTLICSPRVCLIGGPGEPCDCSSTITTGQACGDTTSGVPIGGACVLPNRPCQALLSCNNGVCEDRLGSCPF